MKSLATTELLGKKIRPLQAEREFVSRVRRGGLEPTEVRDLKCKSPGSSVA